MLHKNAGEKLEKRIEGYELEGCRMQGGGGGMRGEGWGTWVPEGYAR